LARRSPKLVVFAGSVRPGSLSGKLAALAARDLATAGAEVTHISLADYALPIYDGDLEDRKGIPENATRLARLLAGHEGAFIATPEYNHSLPPLLKNAIDWISRVEHTCTTAYWNKVYGLGSTSDGFVGGARALVDLRKVLATAVRGMVIPERIEIAMAQHAFDDAGELIDEVPRQVLATVVRTLVDFAGRMAG
jgi:chromate reductase, NAD(P)H dehydrogenase (quinone)